MTIRLVFAAVSLALAFGSEKLRAQEVAESSTVTRPNTGLAASQGLLVVPAMNTLVAYH